jgi:hypothetical protein
MGTVDVMDVYIALFKHFTARRGAESWTVPVQTKKGQKTFTRSVPKTSNADVVQLAIFWTQQIASHPKTRSEMNGRRERWAQAAGAVSLDTKGAKPDDVYANNRAFWAASRDAAVACDVEREMGDSSSSEFDAVVGFFTDTIPDAVGDALGWIGDKLESGAKSAGRAAGGAARGLLDELGIKSILIGAGVIAGAAVVLPTLTRRDQRKGGRS